ncbi:MAG: ATP-binding protein [Desulfurococcales archaeon]|nr:ATP-binding protein [Desulfurococcales archaeon]
MPVDTSAFILEELKRLRKRLDSAISSGDYLEASRIAKRMAYLLRELAKQRPWSMTEYLDMAARYERLAASLSRGPHDVTPRAMSGGGGRRGRTSPERVGGAEASLDETFEREAEALETEPTATWDDVAGLEEAKRSLAEALFYSMAKPSRPVEFEPPRRFLLFGPPGTGKTLLGMAAARSLGARFYYVSVDRVLSRYVGDSPRMLAAVFRVARRKAPSIIFFDEVEVLARRRGGDEPATGVVQTFLTELDGVRKAREPVIVMAATNRPWDLDEAIVSRFERRIYVPLPDREARKAILEIHTVKRGFQLKGITLDEIAEATEGYSGRDLRNLAQRAIMRMLRRANPMAAEMAARAAMGRGALTFKVEPLTREDFMEALREVKPAVRPEDVKRYLEWARTYGEGY